MSKVKQIAYSADDLISLGDFGIHVYGGTLNENQLEIAVIRIQLANVERGRIPEFEKDIMKKVNKNPSPYILLYKHIEMDDYFLYV